MAKSYRHKQTGLVLSLEFLSRDEVCLRGSGWTWVGTRAAFLEQWEVV